MGGSREGHDYGQVREGREVSGRVIRGGRRGGREIV